MNIWFGVIYLLKPPKAKQTPSKVNTKKTMSKHFIFKLLTNKGGKWGKGNKGHLFNEYGVHFGLMTLI